MTDQLEAMRDHWDGRALMFTELASKRLTVQCASHLHSHMQLDRAQNVLEVAAGGGVGSLDVAQYLLDGRSKLPKETKRTLTVTDLSPRMVELAKTNLSSVGSNNVEIKCREANGQDLVDVPASSMDRYIASLCLQLAPDPDALLREAQRVLTPDGIAGFTIWGSPDRSGNFVIAAEANRELSNAETAMQHPNFAFGKDLTALRQRFADAGFKRVQIWPFQCVVELWSGEEFAKFNLEMFPVADEEMRAKRFEVIKRLADEWLAKGTPIGLETYIILARK